MVLAVVVALLGKVDSHLMGATGPLCCFRAGPLDAASSSSSLF